MSNKQIKIEPYTIIRDTREKDGFGWTFDKNNDCLGTEIDVLKTGDYSIKGYENLICVERKYSTGELGVNMYEKRFEEELKRMEEFRYPYMVFEFDYQNVLTYPIGSGVPKYLWHKITMNSDIMNKILARYQIQYKCKIIFAGKCGKEITEILFRQFMKYGKKN